MGVKGLWQLLEPSSGSGDLEAAKGKVLSVDISIWIQQIIKGMRDGAYEIMCVCVCACVRLNEAMCMSVHVSPLNRHWAKLCVLLAMRAETTTIVHNGHAPAAMPSPQAAARPSQTRTLLVS